MRVKLARDDKNSNYKVSLKNIKKEKEFVKLLGDYNIEYKKTEYFKDFFMYNLKNINSKFIMLLQEKASNYIAYIEPMSVYSLPIKIDNIDGEMIMTGVKSFSVNGNIASSSGTSFATARMSSLATIIYQNICKDFDNFSDFDAILIKALIIHSSKNTDKNLKVEEIGFGVPADSQEILSYFNNENIKIISGTMKDKKVIDIDKIFSGYKRNMRIKVTLAYETELDFYQNGEYIKSDIKIRSFSENGKNLIRKFEADIERGEKLELYSNSNVEKKYTLIIEKI